jgi:mRNA-degrading endonuclease RelE of RelBE toxin-antitoxin system
MKYLLVYTKTAFDDIKKLDPVAKKRIKKKLEQFSLSPFKYAKN